MKFAIIFFIVGLAILPFILRSRLISPSVIHKFHEDRPSQLQWTPYSANTFASARAGGRPLLVYFWAEWCGPCHLMEQTTFQDTTVRQVLQNFNLIRVDATLSQGAEIKTTFEQFSVVNIPTILFFGKDGSEHKELRLLKYENKKKFLTRLKEFIK